MPAILTTRICALGGSVIVCLDICMYQLLLHNVEHLIGRNVLHALCGKKTTIGGIFCFVTGATPDIASENGCVGADGSAQGRIGWAMNGDQRRTNGGGYVHGAA